MSPNDIIDRIFSAIAKQEGAFDPDPNVIPRRQNNPTDLRYAGQVGASRPPDWKPGDPEPIAIFENLSYGITAGYRQIWLNVAQGNTLRMLIWTWAPPSQNNSAAYLANVSRDAHIPDVDKVILEYLVLEPPEAFSS